MTESTHVEIHEFSTGIRHQGTSNNWVSLGFTGQYMNVTIPEIPYAVERSIANKEFAVAEGASSDQRAVIGRVVLGANGEPDWSVVAIVTRGRDEKGRSASFYRYFLCKRDDSLPIILAWIEEEQRNGRMPVFNPCETKFVGNFNHHSSDITTPTLDYKQFPDLQNFKDTPVIIKPGKYNEQKLHQLHQLATQKANGQPVAWAFNVEALEQPGRFHIIQAASDKAYDLLQKAKVNTPQLPVLMVDEQAIKSAIKGLINSSTAKPEYVEAIANSLGNTLIIDSYWQDIFDGQGADKALRQGLYTDQFVRLLVLKAIVIPKTLPEYLDWLEKGNKQNDTYKVAAEFESQLSQAFSNKTEIKISIEIKISEGFQFLLPSLLEKKVSPEAVDRLLASKNGIWRKYSRQFIDNIENDLKLVHSFLLLQKRNLPKDAPFKLTYCFWQKTCKLLNNYKQQHDVKEVKNFADIFDKFCHPEISAFFYYVCYNEVPKKIFDKLPGYHNEYERYIYGVKVQRKLTLLEKIGFAVINKLTLNERLPIEVFLILISLLLLSFAATLIFPYFNKSQRKKDSPTPTSSTSIASSSPTTTASHSAILSHDAEMKKEQNQAQLNNFAKTSEAIKKIKPSLKLDTQTMIKELIKLFQNKNIDDKIIEKQENKISNKNKEEWRQVIYKFQTENNIQENIGFIETDDKTYKTIQEKITKSINKSSSPTQTPTGQ